MKKPSLPKVERQSNMRRVIFWILSLILITILSLVLVALFAPEIFVVVMNIFWLILFGVTVIFISLAVLAFLGLRNQVKKVMSVIFEGTLSILDILEFVDLLWKMFIKIFKEFVLFITPLFAVSLLLAIYLFVLIFYKQYGKENDVTLLTILLTFVLVAFSGVIGLPKVHKPGNPGWFKKVLNRFGRYFRDGLEVLIFVFFLTMDSTNLFFLPAQYNTLLRANIGDYDLMKTSITMDDFFRYTLTLIIAAIVIELFRTLLILIVGGVRFYKEGKKIMVDKKYTYAPVKLFKAAMKQSFRTTIDDFLKFTVFTTVLIAVFVFFPRLKLLSMLVASCTNLIMDLIFTQRMRFAYGDDLLTKIIVKVARLK